MAMLMSPHKEQSRRARDIDDCHALRHRRLMSAMRTAAALSLANILRLFNASLLY